MSHNCLGSKHSDIEDNIVAEVAHIVVAVGTVVAVGIVVAVGTVGCTLAVVGGIVGRDFDL